ncbi:MAG: hypothetical protein ACP6IS_07405 [Candidatus Asgardarchaeia archaeon]
MNIPSLDFFKQKLSHVADAMIRKNVHCIFFSSLFMNNDKQYFNELFSDFDFLVVVPDKHYTLDDNYEIEAALVDAFKENGAGIKVHIYPQDYLLRQLSDGEPILSSLAKHGKLIFSSNCQEELFKNEIRITSKTISSELNYCITKMSEAINAILKNDCKNVTKLSYRMAKYALYALYISKNSDLPTSLSVMLSTLNKLGYTKLVSMFNELVKLRNLISEQIKEGKNLTISLPEVTGERSKNLVVQIFRDAFSILSDVIKDVTGNPLLQLDNLISMLLEKDVSEVDGVYDFIEQVPYIIIWSKFGYEKVPIKES